MEKNIQIYKKTTISLVLRRAVWKKHIGVNIGQTKCLCCEETNIEQLNFECGHIIAESKGGKTDLSNLIPICSSCNKSMGTKNFYEFKNEIFGTNISNLPYQKDMLSYICEKIKEIAGHHFFYMNNVLYSFDKHNNLWYDNETETLKKYINDDLYDYIFALLNDSIYDESYLKIQIRELKNYCFKNKGQEEILKAFRTRFKNDNNKNIKFNINHMLIGFDNGVYDLKNNVFRDYEFTDYITTRTGYNYRKSTEEERNTINELVNKIETEEDKRYLLWQILASGIIGKCYQKFFILDGCGSNGKSILSKFMLEALGNYCYKGDIGVLCEKKRNQSTVATPALANMDLKRYIIFAEPEKTDKIKNSMLKEITGNVKLSARKLYENESKITIPATVILECNDKISLQNDATHGEVRRIINYTFCSRFTEYNDEVNIDERIFPAKDINEEFIEEHKYALIDILIEKAIQFVEKDKEVFIVPESVKKSTEKYISSSFEFLNFFDEITIKTNDKNDYIQISNLFARFKMSDFYINCTKEEKREKFTIKKMKEFFESNKKTSLYYKDKININDIEADKRKQIYSVMIHYKFIDE